MTEVESSATGDGFVPYAAFGEEFFALAITEERVLGVVDLLAGQPIEVGPTPAGPGGLARVTASGAIGPATADRVPGPLVAFRVVLPVDPGFVVDSAWNGTASRPACGCR